MEYVFRSARIITSDKIQDRFLTAQIQKAPEAVQTNMGTLFSLVEILNPWFPTSQVGQSIISTLNQKYYQAESTSDTLNFENALKQINENLAQLTQRGETDWIGNLNSVIALLIDNQLHITKVGDADAYLVREGKISKITAGFKKEIEPHPLKTFADIVSGTLEDGDKIIIANPVLFDNVSPDDLSAILSTKSPAYSATELVRILRKEKLRKVNAIIVEILTTESLSQVPEESYLSTVYLDQVSENPLHLAGTNFRKYLLPTMVSSWRWTKEKSKKSSQKIYGLIKSRSVRKHKEEKLDEEIETTPPHLVIHDYSQKSSLPQKYPFLRTIKNFFAKALLPQNRKTFFLSAAIATVVIAALIIFVPVLFKNSNAKSKATALIASATDEQEKGKQELILNNNAAAKDHFVKALSSAQTATKYKDYSAQAQNIYNQLLGEIDKLTATTRYTKLAEIASYPATSGGLLINENEAYIHNPVNNAIIRTSLITGQSQEVGKLPEDSGKTVASTLSKDGTILFFTDANQLFGFKAGTNKIDKLQNEDKNWKTGTDITTFDDNVFILDRGQNQIWKYVKTAGGYGIGREYVASEVNFANASSIVIDGDVYVLGQDGAVTKLSKGKKQNFSLSGIPTPDDKIIDGKKIYTTADADSIYVVDAGAKRIIQFDKKTGTFKHQWALPSDFNNLQDVSLSLAMMKAWILNNNKIYEISI